MKKLFIGALVLSMSLSCFAEEGLRLLFLSKSAGYEHSVIKRDKDALGHAEKAMLDIAKKMGATVECTKDASLINAEKLKEYDVVMFYTTGDLTTPGTDGSTPMSKTGLAELLAWITAGGGFVGFHSANDTFHETLGAESDYIEMIGGEFDTHGKQFKGKLHIVDSSHPAIASLPENFRIRDEWYISKNLNTEDMHALALLDPGRERKHQEKYNIPSYPIIWCRSYGDGRVLYNALGHREDVWENDDFQKLVIDNLNWAKGEGELRAKPNYKAVVPTTIPKKK